MNKMKKKNNGKKKVGKEKLRDGWTKRGGKKGKRGSEHKAAMAVRHSQDFLKPPTLHKRQHHRGRGPKEKRHNIKERQSQKAVRF